MKFKPILTFITLLLLSAMALQAQTEGHRHVIRQVEYITDHYTRENALARELNIPAGKSFDSLEALTAYLDNKIQDLMNLRVLEEAVYRMEPADESDAETGYLVEFQITGSWTIYPIIMPKYDSNSGFRISGKLYYDNFFGTLSKFYLGTNVDFKKEGGETTIPQWTVNPQLSNLSIGGFDFSVELFQQYATITKYDTDTDTYIENYSRYSTSLNLGSSWELYHDFYYSMSPSFTWYYGYYDNLPAGGSNIIPADLQFTWSHSLGYRALDWSGNFREGWAASVGHSMALAREPGELPYFKSTISGDIKGFLIWKRLNPSARLHGVYSFNDELSGLGAGLRGIRDEDMYGFAEVYGNLALNISVIPWKGVGEAQWQPFFDAGIAWKEGLPFDRTRDFKYSAGSDFILYLDKLKSLVARGTIGVDLTNPDWSDGRKYEITIESSLHY